MNYNNLKTFLCLSLMIFMTIACGDTDEALISDSSIISSESFDPGRRNNGPNNNGNQDGNNGPNNNGPNDNPEIANSILIEWMDLFLEIDRYAAGMRPTATARAIAYINLAAYETAVPFYNNLESNDGKIPRFDLDANLRNDNVDLSLALNACYADVMDHFMLSLPNSERSKIDALEDKLENTLEEGLSHNQIDDSRSWGRRVAREIIDYSRSDRRAERQITDPQPTSYEPPTGEGYWTFSAEPERALFPFWEEVRTFIIHPEETSTVAPLPYSSNPSSDYYRQMQEVYVANNSARDENGEQLWIAEFWSDDIETLMFSPPARQVSIANQMIELTDMDLGTALALNLKLGFAMNDAAVACWKYKYEYMVMRPSVFIHEHIDPNYQTNLYRLIPWPNPTFPAYPSGHSTFASAAAGVFISYFGNQIDFTDISHEGRTEFRGTPRSFSSFEELAFENAYARIPLGVHIEMDCTEGLRLGYEVAEAVNAFQLSEPAL